MDLSLNWCETFYDIQMRNQDLDVEQGLRTAVIISIFTDARANEEELPIGETSRRGYWGDLFPDVERDRIGSRLWLLERSKETEEVRVTARQYCLEALQWMIDDGIAASIDVSTSFVSRGRMLIDIKIRRPEGQIFDFSTEWDFELRRD